MHKPSLAYAASSILHRTFVSWKTHPHRLLELLVGDRLAQIAEFAFNQKRRTGFVTM